MMQKRTLYSLLLVSFMAVLSVSVAKADQVTVQSKNSARCSTTSLNVTAVVTSDSISAVEVVLEVSGDFSGVPTVTFDAGFTQLPTRIVDLSQANGVSPDTIRFAALRTTPSGAVLPAGTKVIAKIGYTSGNVCSGSILVKNGIFTYPNPVGVVTTQFVNAANAALLPVAVTNGTVTIVNQAPVLAAIANASLPWGSLYVDTAKATDPDAGSCEKLTYSKLSGPAAMTVNASTGRISWLTTGADVCTHTVKILVTDSCGAADTASFDICVTNTAPTISSCPAAPIVLFIGDALNTSVQATDADHGPNSLVYQLVSDGGIGVTVNPATGAVTWVSDTAGIFTICVRATDGANTCSPCSPSNSDTCCFTVQVRDDRIFIEKVHKQGQGEIADVDITMQGTGGYPMGGFDFLVSYDQSAMSLQTVLPGKFITDCGWEYFTFRFGPYGNCGSGCPSGILRIVAIAETNNGANHPSCYTNGPGISNQLAVMRFLVSNDRTLECQLARIHFIWYDCGDNALSSVGGDTLIISRQVWDYNGQNGVGDSADLYNRIDTIPNNSFPTYYGAPPQCNTYTAKGFPVRYVNFYNGGIDIVCADSIDAKGDVNLNGISYEIADAVMFTDYFVKGLSAFGTHVAGSVAATDVNADGLTLSVADLVYLIRVVVGDALPTTKPDVVNLTYSYEHGVLGVDNAELGAAFVVVAGNVTPTLLANNVSMNYSFDGTNTRILVYPTFEGNTSKSITGFTGNFLQFEGEIVSYEMATVDGAQVAGRLVPKSFSVDQNYPNPFNPKTTIHFGLPTAGNYSITFYNVNGQVVESVDGNATEAGYVSYDWDASKLASGVYFYKVVAGNFSSVKKAVLLK